MLGISADEFGLSADIISSSLGPSIIDSNIMFSSSTPAPLPLHPIAPGLSDSPSMSAYITTGSPGSETNNSQLIWKQSANLPDPHLLKHLYEAMFLAYASTTAFTLLSQDRRLLRLSSSRKPASTTVYVPLVSMPFLFTCDVLLIHTFYSNLSLPQSHPKHPRAAVLHAICAVASAYTPAVSNPHLHGTQGKAINWPLRYVSGFFDHCICVQMRFLR